MEKTLYNQVGEIKGKEREDQDSFSFQFTPQNENLKRTRGSLFSLITVTTSEEDKSAKASSFYQAFQSSYYAKSGGSIIKSLSDTLDTIDQDFNKKEDAKASYSLVAAVLWGSVLYVARLGESSVFISRGDKIKKLEFSKVASGVLENQDTICLASQAFAEKMFVEELGNILAKEKFEEALQAIDKQIANVEGTACVVIRLSVNAPAEQELSLGEVEESGEVTFPEESEKEEEAALPENIESQGKRTGISQVLIQQFDKYKPILSNFGHLLLAKVKTPWQARQPGEHVDHVAVKRARLVQIVLVIVAVFIVSIGFTTFREWSGANAKKVTSLLSSVESNLKEAQNEKGIDPNRAKTLVEKAQSDTQEAKKLDPKNPKIKALESEEATLIAEITRSYPLGSLTSLFDFNKLESGAKVNRLALSGTEVLATDKENNSVYSLDLNQKSGQKVDGSFNSPAAVTNYSGGFYLQTRDGIMKVDQLASKVDNLASAGNWGEIIAASTYQDNLYLLDKGKNQIWKYIVVPSGFTSPKAYINSSSLSLSDATGITIDNFVWVATKKAIYKLSLGQAQDFAINNLTDPLQGIVDIFTTPSAKNLYVLDQVGGRVIVISKTDGVYQSQYTANPFHSATALLADEEKKTAYVAGGSNLYSFNLR